MLSITPKLSDCLCDQDIRPVQSFGLMSSNVVVCFCEYSRCCELRRAPQYTTSLFLTVTVLQMVLAL